LAQDLRKPDVAQKTPNSTAQPGSGVADADGPV
jgi:hypothetical protein